MSIQAELTRITNAKAAIKAAIEGKGVTVPDTTLLDGMAALIESIESGVSGVWCGSVTPVSTNGYDLVVSHAVNDELYNAVKESRVIGIAMETGNTEDTTNRCLGGGGITNANKREIDIGVYYYNNRYSPYSNNTSRTLSPLADRNRGVYFGGGKTTFNYMAGKTFIWVIAKIDVGVTE